MSVASHFQVNRTLKVALGDVDTKVCSALCMHAVSHEQAFDLLMPKLDIAPVLDAPDYYPWQW